MRKGFTLIELLVVLAILGILAAMIIASLSGARARARDAQRKSDLRQIKLAVEQYYQDNNQSYPTSANYPSGLSSYMSTIPTDPSTGSNYTYTVDAGQDNYAICADLENNNEAATLTSNACTAGGGNGVYDDGTGNKFFQVAND